jgi:PPIC-type PPIASE domain
VRPLRRSTLVAALAAGLAAATVVTGGCGTITPSAAVVKFSGDSVKIDRADFEKELKALNDNKRLQAAAGGQGLSGAGKDTVDPRLSAGWLTAVIYDKLVTHEFDRRHLTVTPADMNAAKTQLSSEFGNDPAIATDFPKWFQDRVLGRNARAVAVRAALSGLDFSDDSLRKYFDAHQGDFGENCVAHILVKTKPEADAALARLKAGEDFATVAKSVSIDTGSGSKGGDLGCNPKGTFVPEFDKVASELPVGQLSPPVQTQYGFHIMLVKERKQATFEGVKEQVRAAVNAQTLDAYRDFLQKTVSTVQVSVDKRYGTFEPPASDQPPAVVPPAKIRPNTERSDNVPATVPLPGEAPGSPDNPVQRVGG